LDFGSQTPNEDSGVFYFMAENKKSFIAYSDWYGMFKALPDEIAGKLVKHIFAYVNDENPTSEDYVINALFEQVKSTLKRDLEKWEKERSQRSEAGRKSAEKRSTKFNDRSTTVNEIERNPTVNVSVSVNDSVSDNNKVFSFKKSLLNLGVDELVVDTFLQIRKKKKLVNSQIAFNKIKNEIALSKLHPNKAITIAVEKSWGGFEAAWLDKQQQPQQTNQIIYKNLL